ncbi:MAG: hypothetical protein H0U49_00930 [Parachlamydiaceae bacterium]|nr:hypothetical protein [Parachlamydiaceae bacterium]
MRSVFILFICAVVLHLNLFAVYKVDLSLAPENRWTALVNQYEKEDLRNYAAMIDQSMIDVNYILGFTWVRELIMSYGWYASMDTDSEWFADLRAEMKGLADALVERMDGEALRGFREEDLFLLNIGYDFSTYCTSGVYQTENGPTLYRNLDWEGESFKKFAIEVSFEKEGHQIFRSIQFLGQVGLFTAMKPNAYAVALNYRKTPGTGSFGWEIVHNISQFAFRDGWSASILLRYTLEHEIDFSGAVSNLETTELIGPCYFILSGVKPDEGIVIERGRDSKHSRNFTDPLENPKFLVQTNHDVPKPANQDENWAGEDPLLNELMGMGTVSRRDAACFFLKSIDETNLSEQLFIMLSKQWPIYNKYTIFSSLLSANENEIRWILQEVK